jgi:hypothetical protein
MPSDQPQLFSAAKKTGTGVALRPGRFFRPTTEEADMADDKRNRPDQPQGGNQGPDRDRKDREPGGSGTEAPGSGRARREDEEESQE